MSERLQKLISAAGLMSRREAERAITEGRVTVNGVPALLGQRADPASDRVLVDGRPLRLPEARVYVMLHKPRGYVTTLRDDRGRPTVADLVRDLPVRVYPVGRLDCDSEGLLLLTDDGDFAQGLTHPSHEVDKTYRTRVSGNIEAALPVLTAPMVIDGHTVGPARVRVVQPWVLDVTIHEGRNRQVRKMCARAGLTVRRLKRISEGPLLLGDLPPGSWRYLSEGEVRAVRALMRGK